MRPGRMSYIHVCLCTFYYSSEKKGIGEKHSLKGEEGRECMVIMVILSTNSKASSSWRGDEEASYGEMSESMSFDWSKHTASPQAN